MISAAILLAAQAATMLTMTQSGGGGYSKMPRETMVDLVSGTIECPAGKKNAQVEVKLAEKDLERVRKCVQRIDFDSLRDTYRCGERCKGQFQYELDVTVDHGTYSVLWEDGAKAPQCLWDLEEVLREVCAKK